jgi:hypothetical protein
MAQNVLKAPITQGASPSREAFSLPTIVDFLLSQSGAPFASREAVDLSDR